MDLRYDVIVVGGGHAGAEAAAASARAGVQTVLITPDLSRIGQMSCNPAIGGIAKGVVAREVDALGGVMGRATDASRIQFRMLNRSKGPAVWGPRAQCDRSLYPLAVRRVLDELENLDLFQEMVSDLVLEGSRVTGVRTRGGITFHGTAVVVTAGTFLRGRIHMGQEAGVGAGRAGEAPSVALAEGLESLGLEIARFKTGTPPRVDGRSVDFSCVERQNGDKQGVRFAAYTEEIVPAQRPCWITWASDGLKKVVSDNLEKSALHGGEISGRGPRYCPSIEDKVIRFPDAPRHQVFLEPEGLHTTELYVNGLSTSLPADVQRDFLQTVPGLENVVMTKAGYAIEYDYFPPHQLRHSLELKEISGLFFAGQINGTTGYEEAAGQGVVAGINAALKVKEEGPFVLRRDQAYIGVLIDDLVTCGVDEPYRLFTSRAEFRLLLRQDNAIRRLGPLARDVELLTKGQTLVLEERLDQEDSLTAWFHDTKLAPKDVDPLLAEAGSGPLSGPVRAVELLRRPRVRAEDLLSVGGSEIDGVTGEEGLRAGVLRAVEVELKYEGYVERERERAARLTEQSKLLLDHDLPYLDFETLSYESREKLAQIRPETFAQAARVPGVSPADLQNLLLEVRRTRTRERTSP
ncbi:MAG: tRNA uridine-5-carboxymethylaminomethyl(34) synthesis enzyme MnmG [Gemmatimonadota bacterium]|nr:tRNA uridine-5-carboxymethylaminomethyl(34) synthesis enzyme MnmG [Gemmatimonadota bacterium]MEC9317293.1 tRNA uridine-5-carboxymethylaminomethyl(34) synthesis enzyme MnmG [Gemmatimonadota bacterium]